VQNCPFWPYVLAFGAHTQAGPRGSDLNAMAHIRSSNGARWRICKKFIFVEIKAKF